MPDISKFKTAKRERALVINRASLNEEARTVEAVFVSEAPVRSWAPGIGDYDEILDCQPASFDARRFDTGAQFLKEHDRNLVVGKIESYRFENRQGICTLRYAKSALGEEEWGMMRDGIRNKFSVSYYVNTLQPEQVSKDDGNVFRATSWEGLEVSVVSVEADPNCQALRSNTNQTHETTLKDMKLIPGARAQIFREKPEEGNGGSNVVQFDAAAERAKIAEQVRKDLLKTAQEIEEAAALFKRGGTDVDALAAKARAEGWTPDQFRAEACKQLGQASQGSSGQRGVTPAALEVINRELPKDILTLVAANGDKLKAIRGQRNLTVSIDVPGFAETRSALVQQRATVTTAATISGYNGIVTIPNVIDLGLQRPVVADLFSQGTTSLRSVPYMQEVSFTAAAAATAEGSTKPEQSFSLIQKSAAIEKLAAWTKVSEEVVDDIPAIQSYIQARLLYAVQIKEEDALLNGSGTTPAIRGILQTSGIQTQALGADTRPDAIFKGITKIRAVAFFEPDGMVIHPTDWQTLRLLKDGNLQYYGGGPFTGAYGAGATVFVERFWGLPVVITTSIAQGTALVGAFKLGAMLWRRMGLRIDVTNCDQDDFLKNLMTIRVEERLGLEVDRPLAFCTVTGL